jgi:hypothetical protein
MYIDVYIAAAAARARAHAHTGGAEAEAGAARGGARAPLAGDASVLVGAVGAAGAAAHTHARAAHICWNVGMHPDRHL